MSSGIATDSSVRPSTNSPGWTANGSSPASLTSSVRSRGGSRRSIAVTRWLWKTRNESPSRRSTDAGCTSDSSHGSIDDPALLDEAADRPVREDRGDHAQECGSQWRGSRDRAGTERTRGGDGGAASRCGPRRGARGSFGAGCGRAARLRHRRAPRPSGSWRTAHQMNRRQEDRHLQRDEHVQHRPAHREGTPRRASAARLRSRAQRNRRGVEPRHALSSATRSAISSPVRVCIRSVPNASTLNEAIAVP